MGEHIEKATAIWELAKAEREKIYFQAERGVVAAAIEARKLRATAPTRMERRALNDEEADGEKEATDSAPVPDLVKRVLAEVENIKMVATKSGNLKRTMVRDLSRRPRLSGR